VAFVRGKKAQVGGDLRDLVNVRVVDCQAKCVGCGVLLLHCDEFAWGVELVSA